MCRFCLASYLTLPFRTTSVEALIPAIERGLAVTDRLGLLGASVTQHPEFETCWIGLRHDHVRLSIASVRTNTVTVQLAQTLAKQRHAIAHHCRESGSSGCARLSTKAESR